MIVDELDRKLRVKDKKQYCEGASVDDIIEGRRTFRIEDKLNADKYSASFVQPVSGHEVTVSFLADNFTAPLIIKDKDGLGIKIPSEDFTVDDVKKAVGPRRTIDVMDVTTQQALTMSMEKWTRYYNEPIEKRTRTYNVLSLEFSRSRLDRIVEQPRVVKHLDWVETVWPRYLKRKQRETTNLMDKMYYPKVQKYCLMSVAGCYTDFHIDMGGTSVWYHILKGAKTFWLIPPTAKNLALYEKWTLSMKQGDEFFGDKVGPGQCQRITLRPGCTFFIPTGWIHAVHTPVDSLVFGGNFLHSFGIDMQLRIWNMESTTHVPMKFRYPFFTEMHWYVLDRFLQNHTGKSYREKPKKAIKDLDQLTCVGDTCDAVSHDDVIVTSSRIGIDALDTSSQASSDGGKFRKHEEESSSKEKHCRQQHDESQSAANGISRRRSRSSNSLDDDDNSNQNGDQNGGPTGHQNGGHCDVSVTRERKNLIGLFGEEAGMRSVLEFLEKLPSNKRCVPTDIPDPEGLLKHAKAFLSGNDAGLTNTVGDKSLSKNQKNTTLRALQEKVKRAIKQKQTISNISIIVQDLVRCHVCQRKVKDELDDVMSENQYGCLSDIRECAGCYKIVHPACFQKAYPEYGFSGVMLEDLTYTWLCPKCIEDNVQSDLFMKSRDFDKSHDQDHSSMTSSDFVSEDEAPGKTRNRSKVEDNDRIEYRHSSSNYFALHGLSRKRVRVEIWPRNCPDVEEFSYRKRRRNASWCEKSELENKAQNSIVGECRPTSGESNDDGKRKYCNSEISIRRDEPMDSERLSLPSLRICVQRCDETQTNTEHTRECAKSVPSPLLETNELDNIEMTTPKVNDAGTDSVKARCISPKIFYPPSSLTSKELRANTQPTADSIKSTSLSATSQFIETNQPVTLDHVLKTIDIKTVPIHNRTCLAKHFTRTTNSKNSSMSQILKEKESSCLTQPNAKVRAVTTKEINSNTIVIHTTCYPKGNTNAPWCNTNEGLTIDTGTGMSENRLSISAPTSPNGGISAGGFSPKVFYPPTPSVSPKSCQSSPSFKSPRTDTNQSECTLPNGQSGVMESAKPKFSCDMDDSHINRSSSEQVKVNPSVHVDFDVKQTPMEISQTVVGYNVEQTDIFHKNSAIDIEANSPKDHEAKEKSRTECNFKQIGRPGNQRSSGEYEVRSSTLELNHRSHKSLYYSQRSSVVVPKTPEVNQRSTVGNTDTPTNTPPSEWKEKSTRAVLSSLPTPPHTPPFRMGSLWAKEQAMLSILKQPRPSEKSDFSTGIKEMAPVTQTIPRGNIFSNLVAHSQHTKEVVSAKVPQFSNDQDFVFARKESKVLPTIQEKRKPGLDDILNDYFNQNVQDSSQNNYVATNAGDTFYGTQRAEKNDRKDASILGDSTNISGDVYASNSCPSVVVSVAPVMDTSDNEGATQQLNQSTVPKVADNPSGTGNTSDNNKHGSKDSSGGDSSANHPNSASANSGQSSSRSGHVAGRIGSGGSGDGGGDDDDEDGDDRKKRNKKGVPDDATGDQNDKEDSETEEEEENNKNKHDNAHCNTGKRTGRGSNRKRSIDGPSSHSNLSVSPSAGGKEDRDGSTETTPKKIAKKQSPKLGISIKLKHVDCTAENGGEGEIKTPIPAKSSSGKKRKNANKSATTPQSAKRSLKTGSDGTKSSGKSALSGTLRTPSTGKKGKWNIKKEPSTPPSYEDTSCSAITAFAGGNSVASNNSSKKTKDIAQCHKIPDLKPPRALVQKYSVRPAPIPPPPEKVQMSSGQDHPLDRKAWMAVFSWLSPGSLLRCSQACKTFHRWALHHTLWQRMNFSNTHLTQAHIVAIVKRQPVWLDLSWSNISYRKLDWLVPRLPHLRHLDLSGSSWAGVCALCSPSCPLLLSLDLSWVSGLINGCVRDLVSPPVEHRPGVDHSLSRLRNCTTLSLRGANITTLIFPIIAQNLPALTTLQLDFCVKLTDDSVATVAKEMPNLKVLCLSRCHGLSSAVFACVKQIKNLERLEINNCLQISSQDVRGFARDVGAMLDENTGVLVFNLS